MSDFPQLLGAGASSEEILSDYPLLERQFPDLLAAYRERYEKNPFLRGEYPKRLAELARRLREKYKLQSPPRDYPPESVPAPQQAALFAA